LTPAGSTDEDCALTRHQTFPLLVALPLATGFGLLVFLVSGISLYLGISIALATGGAAAFRVVRTLDETGRRNLRARVATGAIAGLVATLCYDAMRLFVVEVFDVTFWPFDIFTRFGHLLVGQEAAGPMVGAVGAAYHVANGMGFGIAYMLFVRRPQIRTALVWAAMLELIQVTLYPTWIDFQAVNEFVSISAIGHATYGAVLGSVARWRTESDEPIAVRP
jgi:hypothetical protein